MPIHDWFVGGVSILAGLFLAMAAATNHAGFFELRKPRMLAASIGRGRARLVFALIGLAFIALGLWIAAGYRVSWSAS